MEQLSAILDLGLHQICIPHCSLCQKHCMPDLGPNL